MASGPREKGADRALPMVSLRYYNSRGDALFACALSGAEPMRSVKYAVAIFTTALLPD